MTDIISEAWAHSEANDLFLRALSRTVRQVHYVVPSDDPVKSFLSALSNHCDEIVAEKKADQPIGEALSHLRCGFAKWCRQTPQP